MASIEGLSAAVASLTSEVAAMHVENQQKSNMLDNIEMKVGALASAQDLQAVLDAQAVLNNTHDQKLLAEGGNYFNLNQRLIDIVAKLDQLERSGAGLSSSAAGSKGWQLTRPKGMSPLSLPAKTKSG